MYMTLGEVKQRPTTQKCTSAESTPSQAKHYSYESIQNFLSFINLLVNNYFFSKFNVYQEASQDCYRSDARIITNK